MQPPYAPLSPARNLLLVPPRALAGCVRAAMLRDTTGVELSEAQRHSHFPATPSVSLSWWFTGRSMLLDGLVPTFRGGRGQLQDGRLLFSGPFTHPRLSYNDGPSHRLILILLPDAMRQLTGVDPQAHVNRVVDARSVLPEPWLALDEAVQHARDDGERWRLIVDFLTPRWAVLRGSRPTADPQRYQEWAQGLALRAATSSVGRSLRQVERRVKRWAGLPMRELRTISRAERTFFDVLAAQTRHGRVAWADVAARGGYADQAHLCRESRRVTGFSPEEFRRRVVADETFWVYRLWE